jgi:hypothetical protein
MKKICLLLFIEIFGLRLSAQDSLQALEKKIESVGSKIDTIKTRLNAIDTSIEPLKDTIRDIVSGRLIIDASALDSARKYPEKVLYKTYLFDKEYKGRIKWFFAILAFIILTLMWIACIHYSINDSLCKDVSFDKSGNRVRSKDSPFSYARSQLLWWTMIILSCYVFFFGISGELIPLNVTSVLLLGFGAIVYGTGKIIDNRQIAESKGTRNQDYGGQNSERPNFIKDILSDDNGISIHRFQAVVFNVVFGIGFIGFFIKSLTNHTYPFPDFTDWQFALIGISSATYLGLKAGENPPAKGTKNSASTMNNKGFPANDNPALSIEHHDESRISDQPPVTPPPNIR